jgi:hypothetical protein
MWQLCCYRRHRALTLATAIALTAAAACALCCTGPTASVGAQFVCEDADRIPPRDRSLADPLDRILALYRDPAWPKSARAAVAADHHARFQRRALAGLLVGTTVCLTVILSLRAFVRHLENRHAPSPSAPLPDVTPSSLASTADG